MPAEFETVDFALDGAVATITLNRPERLNAWNVQLGEELGAALGQCEAPGIRCVVLTGAGRAFSSGADLKAILEEAATGGEGADVARILRERYHPLLRSVRQLQKPVVAAVNGIAAGIGCSLALACDLIVARESAAFMLAFVRVGLVPDGGSTQFVPAAAGKARAFEMAMLGEQVPADRALEWGLINRVVADDDFDAEVAALARRLAAGPTNAHWLIKRALNESVFGRLDEQLELEASLQQEAAASADFREGLMAFVEKREPAFSGA